MEEMLKSIFTTKTQVGEENIVDAMHQFTDTVMVALKTIEQQSNQQSMQVIQAAIDIGKLLQEPLVTIADEMQKQTALLKAQKKSNASEKTSGNADKKTTPMDVA